MARYEITTFDIACSGMERLRNRDEFLLVAYPSHGTKWRALRDAFIAELQACDMGEGFDYGAARRAVHSYCAKIRATMKGRNMRATFGDFAETGEDSEGAVALLYIRDNKARD